MGVVFGHSLLVFFPLEWVQGTHANDSTSPAPWAAWFIRHTPFAPEFSGKLMVRIFWILSGVVLSMPILRRRSLALVSQAATKRYFRLMPLAFVTSLAGYALAQAGVFQIDDAYRAAAHFDLRGRPETLDLGSAIYDALFFGFRSNGPLWTISYEFGGSLILFATLGLSLENPRRRLVWVSVLFGLAVCLEQYFFADFILGLFLADVLVQRGRAAENLISSRAALAIFILIVVAAPAYPGWISDGFYKHYHYRQYVGEFLIQCAAFAMVALAALSQTVIRLLSWKPLVWLGERSFAIYAVHMVLNTIVGLQVGVWVLRLGLPVIAAYALGTAAWVAATILVAHWLLIHVDVPSMSFANLAGRWCVGESLAPPRASAADASAGRPSP